MKFRDPNTGDVFGLCDLRFCGGNWAGNCDRCPLQEEKKSGGYEDCEGFAMDHPKQAAALMGYEYLGDHFPDPTKKVNRDSDTSTDTPTDTLQYINLVYGRDEILCQSAEEATELAQACDDLRRASTALTKGVLKLRRAEHGTTPVSLTEATRNILEECADVTVCIRAVESLGVFTEGELMDKIREKLERWNKRAQEYEKRVDHPANP